MSFESELQTKNTEEQSSRKLGSTKRISLKATKSQISLKDTKFNYTVLKDANFLNTNISEADFNNAYFCNTVMPDGRIENRDCERTNINIKV